MRTPLELEVARFLTPSTTVNGPGDDHAPIRKRKPHHGRRGPIPGSANAGRPAIQLPEDAEAQIKRLASLGLTQEDIADFLEISERTLRNRFTTDPKLVAAFAKGRANGRANAAGKLRKLMDAGDFRAISFFLARRGGWTVPTDSDDLTPEAMADRVHAFIRSLDDDMPSRPEAADDQEFD